MTMESIMIDSTVVRAHAWAAGAPQSQLEQPIDFTLTAGQVADVTQAPILVEGTRATYALMDKAYDADKLIEQLQQQDMTPVIPPRTCRKQPREYDKHVYQERHLIECFIGKLKQFRRVFARFDKWANNYLYFIRFAAVLIWLR